MPSRRRRVLAALTIAPLGLAGLTVIAPSASAASPDLVISEAYGGGGNSRATLRSDFVELANRGQADVDLTGWTLRYYSASGTTPQTTSLSGQVVAGGRYLVKQADGANTSLPALPTPDATGTVPMSSSGARVEIVRPDGQVADRLGWGSATTAEGAPADATDSTRTLDAARRVTVGVDERRSSTSRPSSPRAHT